MGQLQCEQNLDLAKGITICAVLEVIATNDKSKKVVLNLLNRENDSPVLTIQLNEQNFLITSIYDEKGNQTQSTGISPNKFASYYIDRERPKESERAFFLIVKLKSEKITNKTAIINAEIYIDGELKDRCRGNIQLCQNQTLIIGSDACSFSLGELFTINRDIEQEEKLKISSYVLNKWNVGKQNAAYNALKFNIKKESTLFLVEDKYTEIYKLAWLKLMGIDFNVETLDQKFDKEADFIIHGAHGAGKVTGALNTDNPELIKEHTVGLFDFDNEGRESMNTLKKNNNWSSEFLGKKEDGYYLKRNDHSCCYAMLLPIPDRLKDFADLDYSDIVSYIEIENLLPLEFLQENNFIKKTNIPFGHYYKIKGDVKNKLWKKAVSLNKIDFVDFEPIFKQFYKLIKESK